MSRLLDYDPITGISSIFHGSDDGETFTIETVQDVKPILEENKTQQNEGFDRSSELWHAASIPVVVQLEWMTKYGVDIYNRDHMPAVKRLLNSSDYSHLKRNHFTL